MNVFCDSQSSFSCWITLTFSGEVRVCVCVCVCVCGGLYELDEPWYIFGGGVISCQFHQGQLSEVGGGLCPTLKRNCYDGVLSF